MSFGKRLADERKRLGMKQAEFVARLGIDVPRQSLYENDRRELRADYLARIAELGIDILYVVTGRRGEGARLDEGANTLLADHTALPREMQLAVEGLAHALREAFPRPPARDSAD
jgi:transcriptional regulator with XRE-family HTH domain